MDRVQQRSEIVHNTTGVTEKGIVLAYQDGVSLHFVHPVVRFHGDIVSARGWYRARHITPDISARVWVPDISARVRTCVSKRVCARDNSYTIVTISLSLGVFVFWVTVLVLNTGVEEFIELYIIYN